MGNNTIEQLQQLGRLRDQGVLTDAEFSAGKARVLGGGDGGWVPGQPAQVEPAQLEPAQFARSPEMIHHELLTPTAPLPPGSDIRIYPRPMRSPEVGRWEADPAGRHQWRWWSGSLWTESVADNGVTGTDPIE